MTERTISMKAKYIQPILDKGKDVTRRLKKEGELLSVPVYPEAKGAITAVLTELNGDMLNHKNIKWQVGKVYSIVDEHKEPVWYCPKCNKEVPDNCRCSLVDDWRVLRIKVLSIKEEKLMDITNADAVREGSSYAFKYPRKVFFGDFIECYYEQMPVKYKTVRCGVVIPLWNPAVWRIEFSVV